MRTKSDNGAHATSLRTKLSDRPPHRKTIEVADMPGISGEKITIQLLRSGEHNEALALAYTLRDRAAKKEPALAQDDGFFEGLRVVAHLFLATRDAAEPDDYPAFPSADWIAEHLHTHEIQTLLRHYNLFVGEVFPAGSENLVETAKLIALLEMCAEHAGTDAPNLALARFTHEVLVECLIRAAVLYADVVAEGAELRARVAAMSSAGVAYDEEGETADAGMLSNFAVRLLAEEPRNNVLALAIERVRTRRDAEIVMAMLGWAEGSPSWRRVLGEESGGKTL